jgi:hypothetical protein
MLLHASSCDCHYTDVFVTVFVLILLTELEIERKASLNTRLLRYPLDHLISKLESTVMNKPVILKQTGGLSNIPFNIGV